MTAFFERDYWLRTSDFDAFGRIQPAAILDLFQDVAGAHSVDMGIGAMVMWEKGLMWVLTKVKYRLEGPMKMFQRVKVQTWPLQPTRIGFQREYCIRDEAGELLVRGSSQWVLVDAVERHFMPVKEVYPEAMAFSDETMFEGKILRLREFEPQGEAYRRRPGWSEVDINGHVNNTKYANFVLDALAPGEDEPILGLQMDYHREVQAGTELHIETRRDGNTVLACGRNGAGENMFLCRMELE